MSEFFLELFSEEIPANLQRNARNSLLTNFKDFFAKHNIEFKKNFSFSTPNRLLILFDGINPEIFQKGDYPMQDFTRLQLELDGRAKLVIGDIRSIKSLDQVFDGARPLAFASVDVDLYSSAKAVLKLIADLDFAFLLPTVGLHFDDVWSDWGLNRFAGELLAIEEMNEEYEFRKIDRDRYVDFWHGGFSPWHVSMHTLHVFDHSSLFKPLRTNKAVISG